MAEMIKWITQSLATLKELNVMDTDEKSTRRYLDDRLTTLNSNAVGTKMTGIIGLHHEISDCSKKAANRPVCDLSKLNTENKTIIDDFKFEPSDSSSPIPSKQHLSYVSLTEPPQMCYACKACYYATRMKTLVERLEHLFLEVELPMTSQSKMHTFFFVGLPVKRGEKECRALLGFEYNVKVRDNNGTEVEEARYVLTSISNSSPTTTYVKLVEAGNERYAIDKTEVLTTLSADELTPVIFDMNMIYFIDHDDNEFNLGAKYNDSLENSFTILRKNIKEILKNIRPSIQRRERSEEEKRREMEIEKRRKNRQDGEEEEEVEEEGLFTFKNIMIAIAVCTVLLLIGYFFVKITDDEEEEFTGARKDL